MQSSTEETQLPIVPIFAVSKSLMKLFTKRVHKDVLIERLFSNLISELKYSEKVTAAISKVLAGNIGLIGN